MLDSFGHIKLIDFGLACELTGDVMPIEPIGSVMYMAPEMIAFRTGGRHTDWWALGVLMYELLTGKSPWSEATDQLSIIYDIQTQTVTAPAKCSQDGVQLMGAFL